MKKSTILKFLEVLSSNISCCLFSKRIISKLDFYKFREGIMVSFIFMALMLINNTVSAQIGQKMGIAPVIVPNGATGSGFAIDGDAFANQSPTGTTYNSAGDWFYKAGSGGSLFDSAGNPTIPMGDGKMAIFYIDKFKVTDDNVFATSDKVSDNPTTYLVQPGNVPPKDDMQRIGAFFTYGDESGFPSKALAKDLWCLFAADRWETHGDSYIDFEFNQNKMDLVNGLIISSAPMLDADGDPTGGRTPNDVLITIHFEAGGKAASAEIQKWEKPAIHTAYKWVTHNELTQVNGLDAIYITNNTVDVPAPWIVYDQTGTLTKTYKINQFAEGAINLSAVLGQGKCGNIATVWARTKSSASPTAQLKDLAGPPFNIGIVPNGPVATCPTAVVVPACTSVADMNAAYATWKSGFKPTAGKGVDPVVPSFNPALPANLPANAECGYTFTTKYTLTDYCGKTDSCSSTFTVTAPIPVSVTQAVNGGAKACDLTNQAAADELFATWLATAKVSGGCSPTSVPDKTKAPDYCGGSVTVTWTVTDKCYVGTSYSATYTITPPPEVIIVKASDKEFCSFENQEAANKAFSDWLLTASVSGGCASTSTPNITTAPLYNGGSVMVTWTIADKCYAGLKYSATFTINPLPKIVCPTDRSKDVDCGVSSTMAQANANSDFATWFAQFNTNNPGFDPVVTYVYTPASAQPATGTAPVIPRIGDPVLTNPTSVKVTWTITDENGCESSCSAKYELNYACQIGCDTKVTNLTCNGDKSGSITVTALGGTQPYIIYLYKSPDFINPIANSGQINSEPGVFTFSALAAGDYLTESTDLVTLKGNGTPCNATVTEPKVVVLEIASTNVSCYGLKDGILSISSFDGTGTPTFSLSTDGTNFIVMTKTEIETGKYSSGTYYIKVSYPDGNTGTANCELTKSTTIKEPALVSIKISGTNVTCNGNGDGKLFVNSYSGDGTPTFYLKKDAGDFVEMTKSEIEAGSYGPGTYTIKIAYSDGNNPPGFGVCSKAEDKVIIEPSQVSLAISSTNVTCNGKADGKLSITSFTGTGTPSFYLKTGAGDFVLTTKDDIEAGSYGPNDYMVKISYPDGNNPPGEGTCNETKPAKITQPDAVLATDESTKANCVDGKDGTVTITFSGGTAPYMVNFNDGGFATQTSPITYSGLAVGTYSWIVKDANECSVPGSEDVGFIPCEKALCTYTQGYYGNVGGMSCAEGKPYTTTALITKALEYYSNKMIVGYGLNTISISSPTCVISVLPGGGGSYKLSGANDICTLPSSYLKKGRINNTLLAQTITLGLNIGINSALGDFALQAGTLAIAMPDGGCGSETPKLRSCSAENYMPVINEYQYYTIPDVVGLLPVPTVQGLYDMANKALGGEKLLDGITLSNLASAVDVINNAFDGCRISMGYDQKPLLCDTSNPEGFVAFEVPIVNNQLTIKYKFAYVSDVMIDVFDTTGNKVYSKADTNSYLDKEVVLNYNFNIGLQKVYIIRVTTKLGHSEQKVLSSPY